MSRTSDFADAQVVICDDSITNVMILTKLVEAENVGQIHSFTDPRKLLAHLTAHARSTDLLLLDIEMPYLSGFDIMRILRNELRGAANFPVLIITGLQDKETRHHALLDGANDFLSKPFDPTEVELRVRNLLRVQRALRLQEDLAHRMEQEVERRTRELNEAVDTLVHRLALAGEMRDNETGLHVARVGRYSRLLADGLGLPPELCFMIEKTAPLHDIGKIGIPDSILHKRGELDGDERRIMNTHTEKGAELLGEHDSMLIQMAASIARSHHERWDGSGYPLGLRGESIPIEGRIVAVSDVFDALTTKRPYKDPWPVERAVEYMRANAGSHFDPSVVRVLVERLEDMVAAMAALQD